MFGLFFRKPETQRVGPLNKNDVYLKKKDMMFLYNYRINTPGSKWIGKEKMAVFSKSLLKGLNRKEKLQLNGKLNFLIYFTWALYYFKSIS